VAEMRRRGRLKFGKDEFEAKDLFMDFKGIQITIAKMAQALIDGRIDCKTAGRLAVHLQTMSKLLWLYHRGHRGTQRKALTTKDTKEHKGVLICKSQRFIFNSKALAFPAKGGDHGSRRYRPGQQTRAA
jgi:hypothetical protein